jgi:Zn-dependent peptidase ImmA (M78 family)
MGEDGNEIWVEAGLSEPEKRFTIVHELVHARRQRAGEDLADDTLEEAVVELEAVARVAARTLRRMPSGMILSLLHDYLTDRGRDDPNTRNGLRNVHLRVGVLLGVNAVRR